MIDNLTIHNLNFYSKSYLFISLMENKKLFFNIKCLQYIYLYLIQLKILTIDRNNNKI